MIPSSSTAVILRTVRNAAAAATAAVPHVAPLSGPVSHSRACASPQGLTALFRCLHTTWADTDKKESSGGGDEAKEPRKTTRFKLRSSRPSVGGGGGGKARYPRVYTRTGDGGNSSLFTGERRSKSDAVFHALGTTDELSSHIGLSMEFARQNQHPYVDQLQRVQCLLQDIGSALATPHSSAREVHLEKTLFNPRHTKELEEWIDEYSERLPPLENFILPGGVLRYSYTFQPYYNFLSPRSF